MARISGVMITLNEAHQVHWALGTLAGWCDEIILVDQHSDDATAEIARSHGATVVQHERTGGMADPARRFAVAQATGDWIVILDADEMIPPGLARELRAIADADAPVDVVWIPRANVVLGRWLQAGANWPNRHPRFFRAGHAEIGDRIHHSLKPKKGSRVRRLPADPELAIWHYPGGDVSDYVRKVDRYTTIEARQADERGAPVPRDREMVTAPLGYLWSQYVRTRGWRDGPTGLFVALSRAYYRTLIVAKRLEARRIEARRARIAAARDALLGRVRDGATVAGASPDGETAAPARTERGDKG